MALAITKSPTLKRPSRMPNAVMIITAPMPSATIVACPVLSTESEVCAWMEAWANFAIDWSNRRVSCASLLKYLTVS